MLGNLGDESDIFARGQAGDEIVELENKTDGGSPVLRELFLVGGSEIGAAIEQFSQRSGYQVRRAG